ncbi:hypothetical protein DU472_04535 [Campylobacter novaezeelandiae]|uniref:hypothetical protein n=1 Tax=Campylobacter novaezeelandiae TaxID=2267891 RepID=UPI001038211E|nr:hypothetical protein [Campylobacter novaezeelandiae]TBR80929.1 hypothetical protein DU472_04535 [Campylobacter novaezeelandiae]
MDKAQLIIYLESLSLIVAGLIVCCILYLFKNKINKITPDNIENINSNIKDLVSKNIKNSSLTFNNGSLTTDDYYTDPFYSHLSYNIHHNSNE